MRSLRWIVTMLLVVAACTSDPRASLASTPPGGSASAASTTSPGNEVLAVWRGRVAGHTATYLATIECDRCQVAGTYQITERQGTVTHVEPVGSTRTLPDPDQWSLTTVLKIAASAKGPVEVYAGSTQGRITVRVDVDPARKGDEFTYTVSDIVVT
jgi:hypothetical protein